MPETIKKKAILFVHGAYYFNFGSGIEIFESKLDRDFKEWKKVRNQKGSYSFLKKQSSVDVFFHRWRDSAPFLDSRLLLLRIIDSLKTAWYFYTFKKSQDNETLRLLILSTSIFLIVWVVVFFGSILTVIVDVISLKKTFTLITDNFHSYSTVEKSIYGFLALFISFIILIRPFFPLMELMNLSFLIYAYEKDLYVDGVHCKNYLLLAVKRTLLEIIDNEEYEKILLVGHSMGGVLISDALYDLEKTFGKAKIKKIRKKIKLITTGSTHGLLESSPSKLKILDSENWDFYFCKEDKLSTQVPREDAQPVERKIRLGYLDKLFLRYHLYYLKKVNYRKEINFSFKKVKTSKRIIP